jgi:hypothetical protein
LALVRGSPHASKSLQENFHAHFALGQNNASDAVLNQVWISTSLLSHKNKLEHFACLCSTRSQAGLREPFMRYGKDFRQHIPVLISFLRFDSIFTTVSGYQVKIEIQYCHEYENSLEGFSDTVGVALLLAR